MKISAIYVNLILLIITLSSHVQCKKDSREKMDKYSRRIQRRLTRRDNAEPSVERTNHVSSNEHPKPDHFPLRDQANMSKTLRPNQGGMIKGSKKAITIARMDYLRKDWCKTEPFMQVVRVEGCLKRKIQNRFCYGQCNSFFIPKLSKSDKLSAAFQNCSTCKPKSWDWITITLRCPGLTPNVQRKKIQRVKHCKCMAQSIDNS